MTFTWDKQKDEKLLELAAKHPNKTHGIAWGKILKDPRWKWIATKDALRHRYYILQYGSKGQLNGSKPNGQVKHRKPPKHNLPEQVVVLNYCPNCGTNLHVISLALQLEKTIGGES